MSKRLREKIEGLLEKERGTVYKSHGGRVRVCLVYPNTYHVGMSSLGFQGVYGMLNERDGVVCERAFLPDPEDLKEHLRTGTELMSLESRTPLGRFDIVAFSVSFENDYPNILRILELSSIPPEAHARGPNHPLLVMGGVCASANPEPLAPFFDVCFVGEAEEVLAEFIDAVTASGGREGLMEDLKGMEGVYLPRLYEVSYGPDGLIASRTALGGAPERIRRRCVKDISLPGVRHVITTPETEFSDMCLVEAMRGCPWSCKFCLAGHIFNPPRKKPLEAIKAEIEEARKRTARVGLIGPSLSDYPHRKEVLRMDGVDFSITSLRASKKSAELVSLMKGHRSVSIAPEAGTQRLRDHINKRITEEDILETAALLSGHGVRRLRLYFMVGLPTETDEDVSGIVGLVGKIRSAFGKGGITLTLSTFVPKPFTPFEREPMEDMEVVKERLKAIKKGLRQEAGVSVFHDVPKYAYMQGMFSVGDRRVAGALMEMLREPDWRKAARKAGLDPDFYMRRRKSPAERLPWDFIVP